VTAVVAAVAGVLPVPTARAQSAFPRSARAAIERSCATPLVSSVAPWTQKGRRFAAGISWAEGAERACFAVVAVSGSGSKSTSRIITKVTIDSGYSLRYDERYAPGLRSTIVRFSDGTVGMVVGTAQMNESGGGGTETALWRLTGTRLTNVFAQILDSSTTINEATESPCPPESPLRVSTVNGVWTLKVSACTNGETTQQTYRFNGTRFG
jgi:hypothetical protein